MHGLSHPAGSVATSIPMRSPCPTNCRLVFWDTASSAEGAKIFLYLLQCAGQQQVSLVQCTVVWWSPEFSGMMSKEMAL